jgi:hypothetical protein
MYDNKVEKKKPLSCAFEASSVLDQSGLFPGIKVSYLDKHP